MRTQNGIAAYHDVVTDDGKCADRGVVANFGGCCYGRHRMDAGRGTGRLVEQFQGAREIQVRVRGNELGRGKALHDPGNQDCSRRGLLHFVRVFGIGEKRELRGGGPLHARDARDFEVLIAVELAAQCCGQIAKFHFYRLRLCDARHALGTRTRHRYASERAYAPDSLADCIRNKPRPRGGKIPTMTNLPSQPSTSTSTSAFTPRAQKAARRAFLKFVAASPYVAAVGGAAAFLRRTASAQAPSGGGAAADVIANPAEALNVFDFEEAARRKVNPGHWYYMASGVDDDLTLRANRDGYRHVELRPRRLHDATKVDTRVEIWGTTYNSPIFLCPTGGEKSFFFEGEIAVARAAKARGTLQILSSTTSAAIEDVNKALGRPVWFQLYAPTSWDVCQKMLQRVEASGSTVVALTVDNTTGRNSETFRRMRPKDLRSCATCH